MRQYTYDEVRRISVQFGTSLKTRWSWKKGDVLALYSSNCIDTPAITWGCHWAGGVVSPANPAYSVSELTYHLKDCDAKVLVTQGKLLSVALEAAKNAGLPHTNIILIEHERDTRFHIKHFADVLVAPDPRVRMAPTTSKDLAFLVYSSGTTGLPKGVMLSHKNIIAVLAMLDTVEGKMLRWDKDKILSVLPFYHIYGDYSDIRNKFFRNVHHG